MEWDGTKGSCKLKGFTCKYHGWTYGLDGKLKGLPHFGDQSEVDKKNLSLWPIRVARWRGLVFAQMLPDKSTNPGSMFGPEADQAFREENEGFCTRMEEIPLENYKFHSEATHKLACNWKVLCSVLCCFDIVGLSCAGLRGELHGRLSYPQYAP